MNLDIDRITDTINQVWSTTGPAIILAGMAVSLVLAGLITWRTLSLIKRKTQGTPLDATLSTIVTSMILALSAEGMFAMLTTRLDHPLHPALAIFVCSIVEGLLVVLYIEAKKFNAVHGRPGPYGTAFWIVAAGGGAIVAMSTSSTVEVFFRLALPTSVAMLHWIKLTAGTSRATTYTWLITPTRIAARLGLITGDRQTLSDAQLQRMTAKLVRAAYLYSGTRSTRRARQLRKLMLRATPEVAQAAEEQIRLVYGMEQRVTEAMLAGQKTMQELTSETADEPKALPAPLVVPTIPAPMPTATLVVPAAPAPAPAVSAPTSRPALPAGRARIIEADLATIESHMDALMELHRDGNLKRYQIEQICHVGARKANRILALVSTRLAETED